MIVRDEAAHLPKFLDCAAGLWDELCVVDTGSNDNTIEILREQNAVIKQVEWQNDFAFHRNQSLDLAKMQWVVFLDPDELVGPDTVQEIRNLASDDNLQAGAATIIIRDRWPNGTVRDKRLLRVFRNEPQVRFRVPIHEEVTSSVTTMLQEKNLGLAHLQGIVEHVGYLRETAVEKDKKNRDCDILQKVLQKDPEDLYSWYRLLDVARYWNDSILLKTNAKKALEVLHRSPTTNLPSFIGDLLVLIANALFKDNPNEQLLLLERWRHRIPHHPALCAQLGIVNEALGNIESAKAYYLECLDSEQVTGDVALVTTTPTLGLARLSMMQNHMGLALQNVEAALAFNYKSIEAIYVGIGICGAAAANEGVEDFSRAYKEKYGETNELHAALGEYYFGKGDFAKSVPHFQISAGSPAAGRPALKLSQALFALGKYKDSKAVLNHIQNHYPEAKLALWIIEQIKDTKETLHQEELSNYVNELLQPWVSALPKISGS
tara:strand:- start:944 stop:2416 length:1473 start_codon:yes stop_codon:yes gene_type:complete